MHHEYLHQNSCNTVFPRDMLCLRNISADTLHKGDTEDNNIIIIIIIIIIIMLFLWSLVLIIQSLNLVISVCLQLQQNILPRHLAIGLFVYSEELLAVYITFFLVGYFTEWFCIRICLPYLETIRYQRRRHVVVARISTWNFPHTIRHIFLHLTFVGPFIITRFK